MIILIVAAILMVLACFSDGEVRMGISIILLSLIIIGPLVWIIAGTGAEYCAEPEKKIVAQDPVGHRGTTSYVVTAEDGTVTEIDSPARVGQMFCFHKTRDWHPPTWSELPKGLLFGG